ncbi:MAG: flavodoxin domain-containing protein [Candidatus Methanoperedens sp.]|nr:flavodoxin domain-containing protein [Candidatus Methanoperedens sp.]MCZ7361166.1 flavodoxin domain-containing protein [Candidatus Methanoperedens sp.]HLB72201.1 flavodoxin domain-containing protein [Candidatus Methanoperedens sp.]
MSKLIIIYGTGSHNTERMAVAIEEGARAEGVETVMKNVNDANKDELAHADAIAIGSPNYNNAMMPTVRKFLDDLRDIDLSGKVGLAFGSYGWGFEATQGINNILKSYGIEMIQDLCIKRMPGEEELELSRRVGSLLACKIKN